MNGWFGCRREVGVGSRGVVWFVIDCCRGVVGSSSRGVVLFCDVGWGGGIVVEVTLEVVGGSVSGNWSCSCCSRSDGSFPSGHACMCGFGKNKNM